MRNAISFDLIGKGPPPWRLGLWLLGLAGATTLAPTAQGQVRRAPPDAAAIEAVAAPADPAPRDAAIEALERRVAELEARQAAPPPPPPPPPPGAARVTAAPGQGFTVSSADGRFSATWRARLQIRDTVSFEGSEATNELNVKTLRFTTSGHALDRDLRYNVQLAFGGNDYDGDSPSPIFDAWVESTHLRDLNVRVGQFLVPFDRARTLREFALHMVDRPQVVRELSLDRDIGVMVSSQNLFATKVLGYHAFVGGGDGRNVFGGQKPGALVIGRLVARPWGTFDDDQEGDLSRQPRPRLALGVAGAYNHASTRQQSTIGEPLRAGSTNYSHFAADLVFKYGGFSFIGEWLSRRSREDIVAGSVGGEPVANPTRSGHGYFVQAGVFVHPLVELTGRHERIFARGGTDPKLQSLVDAKGSQLGGGVNLYLNGHAFKLQADGFYIYGRDFGDGWPVARAQLDASFLRARRPEPLADGGPRRYHDSCTLPW